MHLKSQKSLIVCPLKATAVDERLITHFSFTNLDQYNKNMRLALFATIQLFTLIIRINLSRKNV